MGGSLSENGRFEGGGKDGVAVVVGAGILSGCFAVLSTTCVGDVDGGGTPATGGFQLLERGWELMVVGGDGGGERREGEGGDGRGIVEDTC
jgi:hypothetical protein